MDNSYTDLITFNFGKRVYVVMKNSDRITYFEKVNGSFIPSITNFNLYDNEGKSLTQVNQHFFMSELINRVNVACKKGFLTSDKEIVDYLFNLKGKAESDSRLKKIFKGSLMEEINVSNFESNKREITSYLDEFRFDNFVKYNNISVFPGSIHKDGVGIPNVSLEGVASNVSSGDDGVLETSESASSYNSFGAGVNSVSQVDVSSSDNLNNIGFNQVLDNDSQSSVQDTSEVVDVSSSDNLNGVGFNQGLDGVSKSNVQDTSEVVDVPSSDTLNNVGFKQGLDGASQSSVQDTSEVVDVPSSDTLNNVGFKQGLDGASQSSVQDTSEVVDVPGSDNLNSVDFNQGLDNTLKSNVQDTSEVVDVSGSDNLNNIGFNQGLDNVLQSNVQDTSEVVDIPSSDTLNNVGFNQSVDVSNSIFNQVPSDFNQNQVNQSVVNNQSMSDVQSSQVGDVSDRQYGVNDLSNTFVQDSTAFADLDELNSNVDNSTPSKKSKKGNTGAIVLVIVLLLILVGFGYYLYNFVF